MDPHNRHDNLLNVLLLSTLVMLVLNATAAGTADAPAPQQCTAGGEETALA